MLKYGDILQIANGNSKTLIPRNLTYNNYLNTTITNVSGLTVNNTTSNGTNYDTASITDLTVRTINVIPNTTSPCIAVQSPIAFSLVPADYQTNNFTLYPIYFSQDILINTKNFIVNSGNVTIKDNVILLNSNLGNTTINTNTSDNIISGFIFPIADKNINTDFYAGVLYLPNNKIQKVNSNSSFYNWTNSHYNYFTDINKGFFKLKYLPQSLNFSSYNNNMDQSYTDLVNNNANLSNLLANSIALNDGEIVGLNNNLIFNLSDGTTIYQLINIEKTTINILNNLALSFINNFTIKDINNNKFISLDGATNLITFYNNILLNNSEHIINFNNILDFNSNNNSIIKITAVKSQIELFGTTIVDNLQILNSFELNNIPFIFINNLNIVSNNITFMNFNSVLNTINMYQPTYINNLFINNSFQLNNNIPILFNSSLYMTDNNSVNYMYLDAINVKLNLLVPTYTNNLYINTSLNLLNDIPVNVSNIFSIKNTNKLFATFNTNHTTLYNNLLFNNNNPVINFNSGNTLNITNTSNNIILGIDSTVTITGPNTSYQDISNTIVSSSFNITNTAAIDYNLKFIPIAKTYIASGITQPSALITFEFLGVLNINNMTGKLIGTTWALNTPFINSYEINLWTYLLNITSAVGHSSLSPINTNNVGNWFISSITINQPNNDGIYNLYINCNGSTIDKIIWGFKLDILQI